MSYVHSFWLGCYFLHTFVDYVRCSDHPCLNSISCTDLIGDYSCLCQQGFTDKNCSTSEFFNVFPLSGSCFSIRLFTESKTWKKEKFLRVSLWLCYNFIIVNSFKKTCVKEMKMFITFLFIKDNCVYMHYTSICI